jgi:hypothetical protein
MKIISIDPGGTTGYVIWEQGIVTEWGQIGPDKHHLDLWNLLKEKDGYWPGGDINNAIIVCERFDPRNDDFAKLISKEYIGVVELYEQYVASYCGGYLKYPVVWVGADKMKWATDDKLERLGLMIKPKVKNKDALAAMRHLVAFICNYTGPWVDSEIQGTRDAWLRKLKDSSGVES